MAAIVGFVLGESFTNPAIAEIAVSETEGIVYFRKAGAVGFDGLQGLEDLRQNCWMLPAWTPMSDVRRYGCLLRRLKRCAARNCESIDRDIG